MSFERRKFTALRKFVTPHVPGAPPVVVDEAIRDSAIEFCTRSLRWVFDHGLISLKKNVKKYYLSSPECTDIEQEISVVYEENTDWIPGTHYTLNEDKDAILLETAPGADNSKALAVKLAIKPSTDATDMDRRVFDDFYKAIAAGAVSLLKVQPDKPWSDLAGSQVDATMFVGGVIKGRIQRERKFTRGSLRIKPKDWVI
jgi:hypothetical protein